MSTRQKTSRTRTSLCKAGVVRIVGSLLVGPFQSRVYEVEVITGNDEEEGA